MVNGTQMTVCWHVDDLKASHKEEGELAKLVMYLKGKYGDRLSVHEGDVHDYLGVDLDYSENGKVKLSMIKHLEKVFEDFQRRLGVRRPHLPLTTCSKCVIRRRRRSKESSLARSGRKTSITALLSFFLFLRESEGTFRLLWRSSRLE
jgi:hypothetical protein